MASEGFLDSVRRSLYGGRFKQAHVDGLNAVVASGLERGWSREWLAYALATAYHETGRWMQPIREGGWRRGPSYTDASARRAVANIYAKGIISTNYALPAGPYNQSYYGRGLVQITWYDNYLRLGKRLGVGTALAENPDMALEMPMALDLLFVGMEEGLYTRKKLADYDLPAQFREARRIINGDVRKNGEMIAEYARKFYTALEHEYETPTAAPETGKPGSCWG
jgi:putative chitinase